MKLTYIVLLLLCFTVKVSLCQPTSEREERERGSCLQFIEWRINRYADSLNFWTQNTNLPKFIFEPDFDQRFTYTNECLCDGNPFSYRKYILDRVSNIDALQTILDYKDYRLDSLFVPTPQQMADNRDGVVIKDYYKNFPFRTHSTRYLAERRLSRISDIKKMLSGK